MTVTPSEQTEHPLKTYLRLTDQTAARFGRSIGRSRSLISHVIAGRRSSADVLALIARHTGIPVSVLRDAASQRRAA